jgi:hypothetical protein
LIRETEKVVNVRHSPSAVIADASGTVKMAFGLVTEGFSPVEFLDLLRLLDEIVVRGQVLLVPSAATIPSSMLEPLKMLLDAEALAVLDDNSGAIPIPPSVGSHLAKDLNYLFNSKRSSLADARFETGRLLAAELSLDRPALPFFRQRDIYDRYAKPKSEHIICDLMGTYRRATDALHALKAQAERRYNPDYIMVRLPPISSKSVARAATLFELFEMTLEQRSKWKHLRKSVENLNAFLRSREVPTGKKLLEEAKWQGSIDSLVGACEGKIEYLFANSASHVLRQTGSAMLKTGQTIGSALAGNFPKALEKLPDAFESVATLLGDQWEEHQPWKLRPLRTDLRSYLLTSDRDVQRGAAQIFKLTPQAIDAQMRGLGALTATNSRRVA